MMFDTCTRCSFGRIRPTTAPYVIDYFGQPLVFPNAPAHACDVCGEMAYDAAFLYEFDQLIDQYHTLQQPEGPLMPIALQGM
jgi:YgiT-type zinc finger domain-containing protein